MAFLCKTALVCWLAPLLALAGNIDGLQSYSSDQFIANLKDPACAKLLTNLQTRWLGMPDRPGKVSDRIRTNSVSFQEYALETSVNKLLRIVRAFHVPFSPTIRCGDVTLFQVIPSYYGLDCAVIIQNRFCLNIQRNRISNFSDLDFWLSAFENRPERLDELLRKPNQLTKQTAEKIARDALKALGLENGKNVQLREPPYVRQWETDTGPMPFFDVDWKDKSFTGPNDALYGTAIFFQISGVSCKVAHFYMTARPSDDPALRLPYASNFFTLLGMSETNQFWKWSLKKE